MISRRGPLGRVLELVGLKLDGDFLAFGAVPIVCAIVGAIPYGPAIVIVPVVFLVSAGTAAAVARRRGYSRPRSLWYALVAVVALVVWSLLVTPLVESFT